MLVVTGNGGHRPYTIEFYDNALAKHNRLALIVDCKRTITNLLFLSTGLVVFVAATSPLFNLFATITVRGRSSVN